MLRRKERAMMRIIAMLLLIPLLVLSAACGGSTAEAPAAEDTPADTGEANGTGGETDGAGDETDATDTEPDTMEEGSGDMDNMAADEAEGEDVRTEAYVLSEMPVYPGAEELGAQDPILAGITGQLQQQLGGTAEVALYRLPEGTTFEDVDLFYFDSEFLNDWLIGQEMSMTEGPITLQALPLTNADQIFTYGLIEVAEGDIQGSYLVLILATQA